MRASDISKKPFVRQSLLKIQRELGEKKEAVFEGRDMGTVIFPNADFNFFLTASIRERAKRRYKEFKKKYNISLDKVEKEIIKRDNNDMNRKLAPLKPAKDAVIIDSTDLNIKEVVEKMFFIIK